MPEVKLLLPDEITEKQQEATDAKVGVALLKAAKLFFTKLMRSKGRKTDDDMNAFWAGAAALLPPDLFENKQGRAAMRILGV